MPTTEQQAPTAVKAIRVAHILSGYRFWGVENYVFNLTKSIDSAQFESFVICTRPSEISEKFSKAGINTNIIQSQGYLDAIFIARLVAFLRSNRIDILHTHMGIDSLQGALAASLTKTPIVTTVHFDEPGYAKLKGAKRAFWKSVLRLKNARIDHFMPLTDDSSAKFVSRESVPSDKITVINPGIPAFMASPEKRAQLRLQLGAPKNSVVVLGVGRLQPEKNFDALVRARIALQAKFPHLQLWIAGDGAERAKLQDLVKASDLEGQIKFLGYRDDVRDLLVASDIFVLPSSAEAFGLAAVEAMMAGLPCIGAAGTGLANVIVDRETGLLFETGNIQSLTDKIDSLTSSTENRRAMGEAGKERATALFSSEKMAQKISRVYRSILKKS